MSREISMSRKYSSQIAHATYCTTVTTYCRVTQEVRPPGPVVVSVPPSKGFGEPRYLRTFQHTPGTYPRPPTNSL